MKNKIYEWVENFKIFSQTILNYFYEDDYVVKKKNQEWTLFTYFCEGSKIIQKVDS